MGCLREGRENWPVDFRHQVGIYCLYDDAFNLLYVGKATGKTGLFNRLNRHTTGNMAERWSKFSWFGLRDVNWDTETPTLLEFEGVGDQNMVARALEGVLILGGEPKLNRQGASFGRTFKFDQFRDPDAVFPRPSKMLEEIWEATKVE